MFDYLRDGMFAIVIIILTVFLVFGACFFVIDRGLTSRDDKLWNNGHCDICGEAWQYEQAVGHRSSTSYIYVCDGCGKRIELYGVR